MFEHAVHYSGRKLREIAFPLGGIGTGTVSLTGAGGLAEWQIRNHPNQDSFNEHSFFALWARKGSQKPVTRILEGPVQPPFNRHHRSVHGGHFPGGGLGNSGVFGLPHVESTTFTGAYPMARVDYHDGALPVDVSLTAYNPMIPMNADDSGIPCAVFRFELHNRTRTSVAATLAMSMRHLTTDMDWKPRNRFVERAGYSGLLFDCLGGDQGHPEYGSVAVVTPWKRLTWRTSWYRLAWFDPLQSMWDEFSALGTLVDNAYRAPPTRRPDAGTLGLRVNLRPGQRVVMPLWVCWSFPTYEFPFGSVDEAGHAAGGARRRPRWQNHYAKRFPSAAKVAQYLVKHEERLYEETCRFREAMDQSSVDRSIVHAATSQMSIMRSPTCLRLEDGTFYGYEGSHVTEGSCPGSCTHVWNYAQAPSFLYPALQQSMNEKNYAYNFSPSGSGALAFRIPLPMHKPRTVPTAAVDGQMGQIVKIYQTWKITGDTAWLRELWPGIVHSLEFAWKYWDWRKRGVIEGIAHNTYDIEFYGPNGFSTSYYLAALAACADMAAFFGEDDRAREYRALADRGARWMDRHLWNGEFYEQRVEFDAYLHSEKPCRRPKREIPAMKPGEPKYQYGPGCLSDQVAGQQQGRVAGLPSQLDHSHLRTALRSIGHYNFRKNLSDHANCQRAFALQDESALVLCTWPRGGRPALPFIYCDEAWTGIEYQVASHMLYEGMEREALRIVRAIEKRHDGERRNPWNQFEAGSYYARAMASWGLYLAATGFAYNGVTGMLGFSVPRTGLRCFWSAQKGWGRFVCDGARATLTVDYGTVSLKELQLEGVTGLRRAQVNGRSVAVSVDGQCVALKKRVRLRAGDTVRVSG